MSEVYLAHFGIKGQKWGERRFQYEDGTLTPEGRERYGVGYEEASRAYQSAAAEYRKTGSQESYAKMSFAKKQMESEKIKSKLNTQSKKSNRQLHLEQKYKEQGMSDEDAAVAAYKRARTEKILTIAGATAIAAAGAYMAYRHWDKQADRFLKSGSVIQNISTDANKGTKDAFYASYKEADKKRYQGLFGGGHLQKRQWGSFFEDTSQKIYKMENTANEGIKIAGRKNANKAIDELLKDNDFKSRLETQLTKYTKIDDEAFGGQMAKEASHFLDRLKSGKKLTKEDYDTFNRTLVDHSEGQQHIINKFYDKLKQKGYDAVRDINDVDYSGYDTKSAIIMFNDKKLGNRTISELSNSLIEKTYNDEVKNLYQRIARKELIKSAKSSIARLSGRAMGGGAVGLALASYNKSENNKIYNAQINAYKKEHPNTKLSDKEILRAVYGYDPKKNKR